MKGLEWTLRRGTGKQFERVHLGLHDKQTRFVLKVCCFTQSAIYLNSVTPRIVLFTRKPAQLTMASLRPDLRQERKKNAQSSTFVTHFGCCHNHISH